MNEIATTAESRATLVDIRTDAKRFPRVCRMQRQEAISQMNIIILMAFQFRGQSADALTINQMSSSLIDILNEDEYGIGTKFLSFEEIKRVVRRAALGQGREMYGISVSSLFQALADYCKGEGKEADKMAKEIASRQRDIKMSIIAPMLQGCSGDMLQKSRTMYETEATRHHPQTPLGDKGPVK